MDFSLGGLLFGVGGLLVGIGALIALLKIAQAADVIFQSQDKGDDQS